MVLFQSGSVGWFLYFVGPKTCFFYLLHEITPGLLSRSLEVLELLSASQECSLSTWKNNAWAAEGPRTLRSWDSSCLLPHCPMDSGFSGSQPPGPRAIGGRPITDAECTPCLPSKEGCLWSPPLQGSECVVTFHVVHNHRDVSSPSPQMLAFHCHPRFSFLSDCFQCMALNIFESRLCNFLCAIILAKTFWQNFMALFFAGILLIMIEENCLFQ